MDSFVLIIVYVLGILGKEQLRIEIIPDSYQNDVEWELYKVEWNGTCEAYDLLDSGSGKDNTLATMSHLETDETDCLLYNFTDLYGDGIALGGGYINVFFGQQSIDLKQPTDVLSGDAQSTVYKETGNGGYPAHLQYYIQNGKQPLGGSCIFPNQNKPNTGCHEPTAVDIIFLLDTASDLSYDCRHNYFKSVTQLIDDNLPRENLNIAILTFGQNTINYPATTVINKPLNNNIFPSTVNDLKPITFAPDGGNWKSIYRNGIKELAHTECIGGGHVTIDAIYESLNVYIDIYGSIYNNTHRQQYIILFTNEDIDIQQTKNRFSCQNLQQALEVNGINFILLSEDKTGSTMLNRQTSVILKCLQGSNNFIRVDYFSKLSDYYGNIQELVCSPKINVVVTEIFIDDNNNRFWIEIINQGVEFNISSLEFISPGNVLLGNVFDNGYTGNDKLIKQGDMFIIGNMQHDTNTITPCDIYFDTSIDTTDNFDCSNYININYFSSSAIRTSFTLSIKDNSILIISPIEDKYFIIDDSYSYELSHMYADFTNLTNWRESCYKYGSPGILNFPDCPHVCDPLKCTNNGNGDINALCDENHKPITNCYTRNTSVGNYDFCAPSQCNCSLNYYNDINITRGCILVPPPIKCDAYVTFINDKILITFIESDYILSAIDSYKIYYDNQIIKNILPNDQPISVTFNWTLGNIEMSVIGTDLSDNSLVYADNPKKRNKLYDCAVDIGGTGKLKSYCH